MLRHIEEMPGIPVQGLHKRRIEVDKAARPENTIELPRGLMRILKVLEDRLTHNGIEGMIAKRQPSAGADEIRPLVLYGIEIYHLRA